VARVNDRALVVRHLLRSPLVLDGAIAVALTIVTQLEIGASHPAAHAALLLTLALAFRRLVPLVVAGLVAAAVAAQGLVASPPSVFGEYVAVTLAIYTVAADALLLPAVLGASRSWSRSWSTTFAAVSTEAPAGSRAI
jgi:hypothetical protein